MTTGVALDAADLERALAARVGCGRSYITFGAISSRASVRCT